MRVLVRAFALVLLTLTAAHADEVSCLLWCRQCNQGSGCTTDCLVQSQAVHPAGCAPPSGTPSTKAVPTPKGVPCYDWCTKCKPDDKACPGRCDKQGKPIMTRACPAH
jgi:hypothetical protein